MRFLKMVGKLILEGGVGGGVSSFINGVCRYLSASFERNICFLIPLYRLILSVPNLEVANKMLFH